MKGKIIDTKSYSKKVSKKASTIVKKAKPRKIRRLVFLAILFFACFAGVYLGISSRFKSIEMQYKNYVEAPDRSLLNNELLSYKDISEQFEATFLGNKPCQSLMGGFFYNGTDYSIYPDDSANTMILRYENTEETMCDGLASDINVANGIIFFRKLNSRVISTYSISNKETAKLPLKDVGQFIICENDIYYIDLSSSMLNVYNIATAESNVIVPSKVSSFILIGNSVIYLDNGNTLIEMNLNDHSQITIAKNISAFSYCGNLWMQNNEKVYTKSLGRTMIKNISLDVQCNRLLGVSDKYIYFESDDGVFVWNTNTNTSQRIAGGIFVGASNELMLIYDPYEKTHKVVPID